jgi:hypothetical protein
MERHASRDGGSPVTVTDGAVVVEVSGACLSVRAASTPAGSRPEAMLPAEPDRIGLVVHGSAAPALHVLDPQLLADIDRHLPVSSRKQKSGLRLLVGGAARPGPDGSPPLAGRLSEALGVEVVAPDGPVLVLRRGELFAAGPAGAWWAFVPGRPPEPTGARFPPPMWQWDLPPDLVSQALSWELMVTPIPAGLWVRDVGRPVAELSEAPFAVPPASERPALLIGRPGEERPPVAGIAQLVGALPPPLRTRFVLVPYGPDPAGQAPIAQRLADHLGEDVRAMHGLPNYVEDSSLDFTVIDEAGGSTWRPFVTESVYHPGAEPPTRWAWWPPVADLQMAGPASFWFVDGWVVDVVPSGLLVRPAMVAPESLVVRRPADPKHVDLVVTAAFPAPDNVPAYVLEAIGRLARALPRAAQERLRMLITARVDPPEVLGLSRALRLPVRRLTQNGVSPVVDGASTAPVIPHRRIRGPAGQTTATPPAVARGAGHPRQPAHPQQRA